MGEWTKVKTSRPRLTLVPTLPDSERGSRQGQLDLGHMEMTFVPVDPPRQSWFALWEPRGIGGLLTPSFDGLSPTELDLVVEDPGYPEDRPQRRTVPVQVMPMARAIEFLATLSAAQPVTPSVRAMAIVVRSALAILASGRVLPSVSKKGWECWQLKPLLSDDHNHLEALAKALPAVAHCIPAEHSPPEHSPPERIPAERIPAAEARILPANEAITMCWDAVADRMVRTAGAAVVVSSPLFAEQDAIRIPHLRSWASDLHQAHSPGAALSLRVVPPAAEDHPWTLVFLLRSQLDPSLVIDAADLWRAPVEVQTRFGNEAESDLLVGLRRGAAICPILDRGLQQSAPTHIYLDEDSLDSLVDHLDELAQIGIDVRWPSGLVAPDLERRVVVSASSPSGALPTVTDLDSLMSIDWEFLLDGIALTSEELDVLSEAKRPVVPLRGRWIRLDRQARERLRAGVPEISAADALAAALGSGLELDGAGADTLEGAGEVIPVDIRGAIKELADRLLALDGQREEQEPPGLKAELRPYQKRGLAWMSDLCSLGLGGCLADDMGLGKTIQLLALHALRGGPTLVVCPTSVLANWERECHRFLPGTIVHRFHGASRSLGTVEKGDLVITSYGVVRSDASTLAQVEWDLVVADEAQYAKNPRSRTAKALRQIPGKSRLALTGTPVENRLSELWSILDWTVPGLLGPLETFRRSVATPIERDGDPEAIERLNAVVKPFLLRRKKTDPGIAPELPPKIERDVIVPLTPEQITLYQATTKEVLAELAQNDGIARHGLILKLLTALKQITNHPAQYLGETAPLAGRSGKLAALDDLMASTLSQDQSTLIFSQYVTMGNLIKDHLGSQGIEIDMLHGGLSIKKRQELVDRFQAGKLPVLILSLKAGGTGLNLTRATNVVHYDRWWNPAVEDQATDRAYRIGQDQTVTVHRLVTEGTVEDRVRELLTQKRALADSVIGSGEQWIGNLSDDALAELVQLSTSTTGPDVSDEPLAVGSHDGVMS